MTENFRKSWFEEVGYDTVKICYAGGRNKDIQKVMEEVFKKKTDLKFVITDIEAYQITMDPESRYQEISMYRIIIDIFSMQFRMEKKEITSENINSSLNGYIVTYNYINFKIRSI